MIFLLALGLRLAGLGQPPVRFLDEKGHLPAAVHYWESGQFEPDFWEHPPLRHLLAYAGLQAFGDNPSGWRLRNVLSGAAAAALAFLFALLCTGRREVAWLAGALLATDPLHVVLSRFTFEEVYGGAFFLAAIVAFQLHRGRSAWLVLSAALAGCALATKWYYVPGWLLLAGLSVGEAGRRLRPATALFLACTWLLVPASVYVASYLPWFGRGYGLAELAGLTLDAYRSLQSLSAATFRVIDTRVVFQGHGSAAEWFTGLIVLGEGTRLGPDRGRFVMYVANLPIWGLTLPAMVGLAAVAARRRALAMALPVLFFAASYALFLVVKRPAFIYSASPLLPFAFTAIAAVLWLLAERLGTRWGPRAFWLVAALAICWNLYLYPLASAKEVPLAPWAPILERAELILH
jgi:dolichyl-phosphate-mannose--protein O-mannosyl transferase